MKQINSHNEANLQNNLNLKYDKPYIPITMTKYSMYTIHDK